jgi:hypothetical protein
MGPTRSRIDGLGDWVASAHWTTSPAPKVDHGAHKKPAQDPIENLELIEALAAISEDVWRHCAAVCAGIDADFAGRIAHARKTLPRSQVTAAVHSLAQARKTALQAARQMAKAELFARREAAIVRYRRPRRPQATGWHDPSGASPRR